jgi:NADPH2 dehydrogenase
MATDFHFAHYLTRAQAQLGLIILEATSVDMDGRISKNDLGIWNDQHVEGLSKIAHLIKSQGAVAGIQINHAGRKARIEHPLAPSPVAFNDSDPKPVEMSKSDIKKTIDHFKKAAHRANLAGFDLLEIHAAHGYLIYQFLSPLTNQRKDEYKDGVLFLKEILEAVVDVWPKEKIPIME